MDKKRPRTEKNISQPQWGSETYLAVLFVYNGQKVYHPDKITLLNIAGVVIISHMRWYSTYVLSFSYFPSIVKFPLYCNIKIQTDTSLKKFHFKKLITMLI